MTRTGFLLAAALLSASGCAGLAGNAGQRPLEAALDAIPIDRPLDLIWPEVRHLLAERHFPLAGRDAEAEGQSSLGLLQIFSRAKETAPALAGGQRLETGWGGSRTRYLAEALPAGAGWLVRLTLVTEDFTEHGHDGAKQRDGAAELELVRRVAPEQAAAILERAQGPEKRATPPAP
jgi:hypothetical protein